MHNMLSGITRCSSLTQSIGFNFWLFQHQYYLVIYKLILQFLNITKVLGLTLITVVGLTRITVLRLTRITVLGLTRIRVSGLTRITVLGLTRITVLGLTRITALGLTRTTVLGLTRITVLRLTRITVLGLTRITVVHGRLQHFRPEQVLSRSLSNGLQSSQNHFSSSVFQFARENPSTHS